MRILGLLLLVGCADHGQLPTSCDADFELLGTPGATLTEPVTVLNGQPLESCLALDSTRNTRDVTLIASDRSSPLEFVLRSPGGTELARGFNEIRWLTPAGLAMDTVLSVAIISDSLVQTTSLLTLQFAEMPDQ